jgi:hypothetical protein
MRIPERTATLAGWVARLWRRPLRIEHFDGTAYEPAVRSYYRPVRLGQGEDCDIRLGGPGAPELMFELRRERGPVVLRTPLAPEVLGRYVELYVNGEPLRERVRPIAPGSRLEVVDRAGRHRYELVVSPRFRLPIRPRFLAAIAAVVLIGAIAYGGYLFWELRRTRVQLAETEQRLATAEARRGVSERRILEALAKVEVTGTHLANALQELKTQRKLVERTIREEFELRLGEIRQEAQAGLAALTRQDVRRREQLERETEARIEGLRREFSGKVVKSYQLFKERQDQLLAVLAKKARTEEPRREGLRKLFQRVRKTILFIHTSYRVQFAHPPHERGMNVLGTGFLVSPAGVGITAQHILFPWRFERQFIVLRTLGLAEVVPGSLAVTMWMVDRQVVKEEDGTRRFDLASGYRTDGKEKTLHILHAPEPELQEEVVMTPGGPLTVRLPKVEQADAAVFQIIDFSRKFPSLAFAPTPLATAALDEVLVVGYPLSRLAGGKTLPQPTRGLVRRVTPVLLELDTSMLPGVSGGAILNPAGELIGMAYGILDTPTYGLAVRAEGLQAFLKIAGEKVRKDQQRLAAIGCDPGAADGVIGPRTWAAYQCEKRRGPRP